MCLNRNNGSRQHVLQVWICGACSRLAGDNGDTTKILQKAEAPRRKGIVTKAD